MVPHYIFYQYFAIFHWQLAPGILKMCSNISRLRLKDS